MPWHALCRSAVCTHCGWRYVSRSPKYLNCLFGGSGILCTRSYWLIRTEPVALEQQTTWQGPLSSVCLNTFLFFSYCGFLLFVFVFLFLFCFSCSQIGFISEGTVRQELLPSLLLFTFPSERGSWGAALGEKPVYFRPAPPPGVFFPSCARRKGEEAGARAENTSDSIPANTFQTVSGGRQGFCKCDFTLCWLLNGNNKKHF